MKADIGTLSGGLYECESGTVIMPINGYGVGKKNIPALFWNRMLLTNGKKVIEERKANGNE